MLQCLPVKTHELQYIWGPKQQPNKIAAWLWTEHLHCKTDEEWRQFNVLQMSRDSNHSTCAFYFCYLDWCTHPLSSFLWASLINSIASWFKKKKFTRESSVGHLFTRGITPQGAWSHWLIAGSCWREPPGAWWATLSPWSQGRCRQSWS